MIPYECYEKKSVTDRLSYASNKKYRKVITDTLRYAVRLNLEAFGYQEDQLLYVFDPQSEEDLAKPVEKVKEYLNAVGDACAVPTSFESWYSDSKNNSEEEFAIPFMTLIQKTDDFVMYGMVGWSGTTKQFRKFAKDNFKFYRLIKTKSYFGRTTYNIKIESQDLLYKTLTGEMIGRDFLL